MIKQVINVDNKWKVIVYYNINYNLFHIVRDTLKSISVKEKVINRIAYLLLTGGVKAFTISNSKLKITVVGFNPHKTKEDYINSIVHEIEHVKQHMLKAYDVPDRDEEPAYTMGYLAMKMMMFFLKKVAD